jgi:hypothetical protein
MPKSPTIIATYCELFTLPLLPSTSRKYLAGDRVDSVVIIRIEDAGPPGGGVTVAGFRVAFIPTGMLRTRIATGELNVPNDCTPIATVVLFPEITDLVCGEGSREKPLTRTVIAHV